MQVMTSVKEIEKKRHFIADNTIKCECGHSMFFKRDYHICTWCGKRVYKDDKTKFKYELNKLLKKKNREDENNGL